MPRPCANIHPEEYDPSCPLCDLAARRPEYRRLWGIDDPPPPPPGPPQIFRVPSVAECVHLGNPTGETRDCGPG